MEQPKKTVKIILMRHSESTYNRMQYDWKAENNLPIKAKENDDLRYINDDNIIDAILTQRGIEQVTKSTKNTKKCLKFTKIHI